MIRDNLPLTPLTLHDRMFAPVPGAPAFASAVAPKESKSIDAVLKRVCHVAVLHWHIWSPIVYDVSEQPAAAAPASYDSESSASVSDTESEAGSDVSEASSTTNANPTQ